MGLPAQVINDEARFAFGKNWRSFLATLDDDRICEAERSLKQMLEMERLDGKRFLDVGSGSGLFSLAARRLGAEVVSFDYDPESVGCTEDIRERFFPRDGSWRVERGSVLDEPYLQSLGHYDIVYAWGVLHHTGDMWRALELVHHAVGPHGKLFLSIYNDQGLRSARWRRIKRFYCSGLVPKLLVCSIFIPFFVMLGLYVDLRSRRSPLQRYAEYRKSRGMSLFHDWLDWLGGYPFEVAKPEEIFDFYRSRAFVLRRLKTVGGHLGCNEYVFEKINTQ